MIRKDLLQNYKHAFENFNYINAAQSKEQSIASAMEIIEKSLNEKGYDLDILNLGKGDEVVLVDKKGIAIYVDHSRVNMPKFIEGELMQKNIIRSESRAMEDMSKTISEISDQVKRLDPNYERKQAAMRKFDKAIEESYLFNSIKDQEQLRMQLEEELRANEELERQKLEWKNEEKDMLMKQRESWPH